MKFKVNMPSYRCNLTNEDVTFIKSLGFIVTPNYDEFDPNIIMYFNIDGEGYIDIQSMECLQKLIKTQGRINFLHDTLLEFEEYF